MEENIPAIMIGIAFFIAFIIFAIWTRNNYKHFKEPQRFGIFSSSIIIIILAIWGIIYVMSTNAGLYEDIGALFVLSGILIFGVTILYTHFKPPKKSKM